MSIKSTKAEIPPRRTKFLRCSSEDSHTLHSWNTSSIPQIHWNSLYHSSTISLNRTNFFCVHHSSQLFSSSCIYLPRNWPFWKLTSWRQGFPKTAPKPCKWALWGTPASCLKDKNQQHKIHGGDCVQMHSHNDYFSQNTQNANWASNNSQALADLKFRNRMLMKHEYKSIMHCIL